MKPLTIRFYTPQDNTQTALPKNKKANGAKPVKLEGYISPAGKLVLPAKTMDQLKLDADSVHFKVGTDPGKRKIKALYLVPTQDAQADRFALVKAAKSYTLALGFILQKGGIDYKTTKYRFTLSPFRDEEGIVGYRLALENPEPKPIYTGKPRGRKSKSTPQEE